MRLYLSGPMTGFSRCNYDAFTDAARALRSAGHAVVSPAEIDHPGETGPGSLPWAVYIRRDLAALLDCEAIALLPGWPASRGARLELAIALELGFEVFYLDAGFSLVAMASDVPAPVL